MAKRATKPNIEASVIPAMLRGECSALCSRPLFVCPIGRAVVVEDSLEVEEKLVLVEMDIELMAADSEDVWD